MADNVNLRALALETLLEGEKTRGKINDIVSVVLEKYAYLPKNQRAFYARLVEGTLEHRIRIDYIIGCYSRVPVKKMKPVVRNILRISVYQILEMNSVPDSAAVNEAVKLAAKKGFGSLKGFINGLLRSLIREPERAKEPEKTDALNYISVHYSMPEFLIKTWLGRFGRERTEDICKTFLKPKKTTIRLRSNTRTLSETEKLLKDEGVLVEKAPYVEYAYYISGFDNISGLRSFKEGGFTVQDISSMLCVECAGINKKKSLNILDMCAAPGGKSLLAADLSGEGTAILSRDISFEKTELIEDNCLRCGIDKITAEVWDAARFDPQLEGKMDLVIADVPCSGFGVIGRKPDIKYNASQEGVKALAALQEKIIDCALRYVKPGGTLIYSTCTISKEENEDHVDYILKKGGFKGADMTDCLPTEFADTTAKEGYLQLLPSETECDGFFIAKFIKEISK